MRIMPMEYPMSDQEDTGDLSEEQGAKEGLSCKKRFHTNKGMTANGLESLKGYKYREMETTDEYDY